MTKNKYLYVSLLFAIIFLILHYLGVRFHLYWSYKWFDIPMHLIGGFWLTLFILWISARFGHIDSIVKYKSKAFFVAIISAIIIGIVWEIIELLGGITSIKDVGYLKDSGFYILTTVIGGFFAYLYFIKRRSCKLGVDCELMTDKKL